MSFVFAILTNIQPERSDPTFANGHVCVHPIESNDVVALVDRPPAATVDVLHGIFAAVVVDLEAAAVAGAIDLG